LGAETYQLKLGSGGISRVVKNSGQRGEVDDYGQIMGVMFEAKSLDANCGVITHPIFFNLNDSTVEGLEG